ncbi:AraC-type DNA-binding protein [Hymenobacter daecheongensis DSM 21074]|uniref:AraC-type DNA-binding protein n=1 Tax=Hymenobacter daecheongensis DSM 21074 TaxID=1121955 RepID=A0A1M6C144_9BACT|nr:AraC family transcriptional regulator [Hymenobacter daecheongensis]SHI54755.1 AraC-type DNA-binding protein [Hymenobacter daecheongensis DSM 21074]
MQVAVTPDVVVLFAVLAQAVFAAGLLWLARYNRVPNRFLALLLLAIALWVLDGFFRVANIYGQNPDWYFLPIYYSFAFGPLLYFYVQSLVNHDFRLRPRHLAHFAPVLLQALLYWWLCWQPYAFRLWFWNAVHRPYTYRIEFVGTWLSLVVYLALSLRLLRHYRYWLADNFSETSQLRLYWLRGLLLSLVVVSGQWLVEVVLREFFNIYYTYDYSTWLLGGVVLLLGFGGLRQADMQAVNFGPAELGQPPTVVPSPTAPAAAPREPVAVDPVALARIRRALEEEQLYLNPTLTLAELSAHTGLAPRLISFTVNNGFGKSFNEVVNGYRVAAVQRRLAQPAQVARLTLLGIAFECGFNSKTTFNRIFKQVAGVAPSDYQPAPPPR